MNINRVNSGLIQQAGAPNSRVNLTISDRGVAVENNAAPEKVSSPPSQVTSNAALQNVLTNEETQALIERFGNSSNSSNSPSINFYNGRGNQIAAATGSARGNLIDIAG